MTARRNIVAIIAILLVLTFLARPGVGRLRTRILASISSALGRQVEASSVNLRFLPQPGFELHNFVVHDDPAFGAEPILRAEDVSASLRLFSVLRGRLEIARLSLSAPSVNLVRNRDGKWNLQNLLDRADRIPVAPTSKTRHEPRPGFPYIEADEARINLMLGAEKTPYALTNAEFSVWQDSENTWAMRMKAQPLRSDFNLSDTGLIRLDASWQRAAALRDTPLQLNLQWDHGQLGQLTKLVAGTDKGWRGEALLSVNVKGTPAALHIETSASINDFRRYDIGDGGVLRLVAHCAATYDSLNYLLSNIDCEAPVAGGTLRAAGNVEYVLAPRGFEVVFTATSVPAQSLAAFAAHIKKNIPSDLVATGGLTGSLRVEKKNGASQGKVQWSGSGEVSDFHITSRQTNTDIAVPRIPLLIDSVSPVAFVSKVAAGFTPAIEVAPFNIATSKSGPPLQIQGMFSAKGYDWRISGDAPLPRLFQLARTAGIPTPHLDADGAAHLELQLAGSWKNFSAPRAVGKAQLHSVTARIRGMNQPLAIANATLVLTPDQVSVQNISATTAETSWHGSLTLPRPCVLPDCEFNFDLRADELSTDRLNRLFNPAFAHARWYSFVSTSSAPGNYLRNVRASGKISADRFVIRQITAKHASANASLEAGILHLTNFRADMLGGKHTGEWTADFTHKIPRYSGSGTLDRVTLAQLAPLMRDSWITGTANAKYTLNLAGISAAELFSSATASLDAEVRNGTLPHILVRERPGPLEISRLDLRLKLAGGRFDIEKGSLKSAVATYQVSGSSQGRNLNLKLSRDGFQDVSIQGDLGQPRVSVSTVPETRASLKP